MFSVEDSYNKIKLSVKKKMAYNLIAWTIVKICYRNHLCTWLILHVLSKNNNSIDISQWLLRVVFHDAATRAYNKLVLIVIFIVYICCYVVSEKNRNASPLTTSGFEQQYDVYGVATKGEKNLLHVLGTDGIDVYKARLK